MKVIKLEKKEEVYAVLGIDADGSDRLLAIAKTYEEAKRYCTQCLIQSEFYDTWIEKHSVL
jgi:hypothetical protein